MPLYRNRQMVFNLPFPGRDFWGKAFFREYIFMMTFRHVLFQLISQLAAKYCCLAHVPVQFGFVYLHRSPFEPNFPTRYRDEHRIAISFIRSKDKIGHPKPVFGIPAFNMKRKGHLAAFVPGKIDRTVQDKLIVKHHRSITNLHRLVFRIISLHKKQ